MKKKIQVKQKTQKKKNKTSKQRFNPDLLEEEEEYRVIGIYSTAQYALVKAKSAAEAMQKAEKNHEDYDWDYCDDSLSDWTFECYD